MSFAAIISALIAVLEAAPQLVGAVKAVIAAFEGGGAKAARDMLAQQHAAQTADLEQWLETPIAPGKP